MSARVAFAGFAVAVECSSEEVLDEAGGVPDLAGCWAMALKGAKTKHSAAAHAPIIEIRNDIFLMKSSSSTRLFAPPGKPIHKILLPQGIL